MAVKKPLRMLTVGIGYAALAGHNRNTMRIASEKYQKLQPGDRVEMVYCDDVDDIIGEPMGIVAVEQLVVASTSRGSLEKICRAHYSRNHGLPKNHMSLMQVMNEFYDMPGEDYIAVYFK